MDATLGIVSSTMETPHAWSPPPQDPLGKQGERIRGNASACQVWKRELEHGDLLIVLYNNGHCPLNSNSSTGAMTVSWKEVGVEGYADTVEHCQRSAQLSERSHSICVAVSEADMKKSGS